MTMLADPAPAPAPSRVKAFLKLVVIEHSVFALPFAYLAALTATHAVVRYTDNFGSRPDGFGDIGWHDLLVITIAMVSARTFAMAANRVIDREIDARNPRTAQRELVTGAVTVDTAYAGMAVSLVVFLAAAWWLAPICLALAPVALAAFVLYPYAKRFTWACHYVLGLAQAMAPVGAWLAVSDGFGPAHVQPFGESAPFSAAIWLGLAVGTWIAGFDVIYACQDVESDRREGIHSIPARFGVRTALTISSVTHVVTVGFLLAFGLDAGFGLIWLLGVVLTAAALAYEHSIVRPDDLSRVNRAFFTVNGYVGIGLLLFGIAELFTHGLTL